MPTPALGPAPQELPSAGDTCTLIVSFTPQFSGVRYGAATALDDFQNFLEKDLGKRSDGDFRLGKAKFERKLAFELGDEAVSSDAIVAGARALLASTQLEMAETAKELWPTLFKVTTQFPPGV